MRARKLIVGVTMLMIILSTFPAIESQEDPVIHVHVLIDFGDGEVYWGDVFTNDNYTAIYATEVVCDQVDLDLETVWYSFGVFVNGIGGLHSPVDWSWWWSLWIWNWESGDWEVSMEGASDLILNNGDDIAWSPSSSKPIATPGTKYPWGQFQCDANNIGADQAKMSYSHRGNNVKWIYNTNTIEMPSSPVVAGGLVIINNWGGVFCLSEKGNLLWKNEDVVGSFTPAIGSGKVLVGGKDGFLYALNITNGEQLWKTEITAHPGISGVTSPPTIVRGKVYIGAFNFSGGPGAMLCLDETTGSVLWKKATSSSIYFSSPAFSDDMVYVGTMGLYDSSTLMWNEPYGMYCFDSKNGNRLWYFSVDGSVGSSPTITGGNVLFTSKDGFLYCLDKSSGDLIWKKSIGSSVSSPAVHNDHIYVGSGDMGSNGQFYCLDMDGNIKWQFAPNGAVQSSPAISWHHIFFSTNVRNGTVYCLDSYDGELIWKYEPWPEDYIISSPALESSNVYFTSDNGRLYAIRGSIQEFEYVQKHVSNTFHVGEDVGFHHNYEYYIIRLIEMNTTVVSFVIDSKEESFDVSLNKPQLVDTDGDGKKDLGIMLNELNLTSQQASITLYPYSDPEDEGLNMVVVSILALFLVGLVIMVVIILIARRVERKTGAPESGKKQKKDGS